MGAAKLAALLWLVSPVIALAIPPNTPITNTASAGFTVDGVDYSVSASDTVITDPASGNSPPAGITIDPSQIEENVAGGIVGTLSAIDSDPADTHVYSVSDPRFLVTGDQLSLAAGVALDFETVPAIDVAIDVTDSAGETRTFTLTISVEDVNEPPTAVALSEDTFEAGMSGAVVGDLSVTDPDSNDSHSYEVDDPRFEVAGASLKLIDGEALPLGTSVDLIVTATDAGGLSFSSAFTVTAVPPGGGSGGAGVTLAQYAPGFGSNEVVPVAACDAGSGFVSLPAPVSFSGETLAVPGSLPLADAVFLKSGQPLFIRVNDPDADLDTAVADTVLVTVTSSAGDVENLQLRENGLNSGVFTGYLQSTQPGAAVVNNCQLESERDALVAVDYIDALDPADLAQAQALIDPVGRIIYSRNGQPVDGAQVTLLDAGTGAAATVVGETPGSQYPSTVISGEDVTDSAGGNYVFETGEYRFPVAGAGDYQLLITPPNRFQFPSSVTDEQLQLLPEAPYLLAPGSRGAIFTVSGLNFALDIPLDLAPVVPTPAALELLALDPAGDSEYVAQSQCFNAGAFVPSPAPTDADGSIITVPGDQLLSEVSRLARGDVLFIRVTDLDEDADPFAADELEVSVRVPGSVEEERILLRESDLSTGIFTGYLQTAVGVPVVNDCALQGAPGAAFAVSYVDADDSTDSVSTTALLDPPFTVISSADGRLVDGAVVTVVDSATGTPAVVFGEDGVSRFPATVTSGGSAVDEAGNQVDFAPGTFYYPVLPAGTYRFEIAAPQAYQFPSNVSDAELNALPGGPYVLTEGSRGGDFDVVDGVAFEFDLPLDPLALDLFVSKQASKDVVAVGDFLQYQVLVQNPDALGGVIDLTVIDRLPSGFRYVEDSTQIDGQAAPDPQIDSDGVTLRFTTDSLDAGAAVEVRYVVEVTAAADLGRARNEAQVTGIGVGSSNVAFADVIVREDLLQSKAIIVGEVMAGSCELGAVEPMAGVRVWLEDGTYVVTDSEGKYHIEGVEPGSHVVQLDTDTLPRSYEAVNCAQNTRFAGSAFSQFVDVQPGSLWRADFRVAKKAALADFVRAQLLASADDGRVDYRFVVTGGAIPVSDLVALVMLDETATLVPGSVQLDGESIADPSISAGAMTLRLGDEAGVFEREVRFSATVPAGTKTLAAKGVVMFKTDTAGKQKTPVMTTQLEFNWPDSLTAINPTNSTPADTTDGAPREIAAGVYEPSRGQLTASSEMAKVEVTADIADGPAAYVLPEISDAEAPAFDRVWLSRQEVGNQLLWPLPGLNPRIPAITVAAKHELGLKLEVRVNGSAVNPLSYTGVVSDRRRGVGVSRWDNVSIDEGDNLVEVIVEDDQGKEVARMRSNVHFSGRPVRAEFVPQASHLVADGITPPVLAVRLFDRDNYPARPGLSGEFTLEGEFAVLNPGKELDKLGNNVSQGYQRYVVREDGVAYIQLEPTTIIGEARVRFDFDDLRSETIKARLVPGEREWILVGLVEGQLGYNDVSGNDDAFRQSDLDEDLVTDGRTAFYAKGTVSGNWLLTAAYDTDKDTGDSLRRQIDPNRFYTLYGDGSEQRFDAESNSKLYLKVDRQTFSALWGDFDTGFDDTELTKFTRTLNGLQVDNYGEQWQFSGFASSTDQGFIYDQIPGDGTSGIYRLSARRLLTNSERISIVVRDRFHLEQVIESTSLTRYLDYTIDYDEGTLVFKQPIFSQDADLNPIFIEAEYEVETDGGDELVAGGRIAYRLDDQDSRVALTYVDDNTVGREGSLVGMDFELELRGSTTVRAEVATTDTDINGSAYGYLLEAEHQSVNLAGRAYLREQEAAFGLGQQSALEGGTRKFGLEADYDMTDDVMLRTEMYRQEDINGGGERTVLASEAYYSLGETLLSSGLRTVTEEVAAGDSRDSHQLTVGASRNFLDDRLIMRGNAEMALGEDENTDFPNRSILGAEYVVSEDVSVLAEQEFTWGDTRNTQDTRIGVRARPWTGGDVSSMVAREMTENGERVFATTGLLQQWQINDSWRMDMGADRVQTIKSDVAAEDSGDLLYNPDLPPASGSVNNDFTALFGGIGYRYDDWDASMRLEYHTGDQADKWNYLAGVSKQLADGKITSASLATRYEELESGAERNQIDLRWGLAWRPSQANWMVLNRLDLLFDETTNEVFDTKSRKAVNNMNLNIEPALGGQLSLQLGLKYVVDSIDGEDYDGFTGLYGLEYRRDINERWDWGVHGSTLHSVNASLVRYSAGVSIGHSVFDNTWLSVGYNVSGFEDDDFTAADYTAQGPYMKFRMKLDQGLLDRFVGFVGSRRP